MPPAGRITEAELIATMLDLTAMLARFPVEDQVRIRAEAAKQPTVRAALAVIAREITATANAKLGSNVVSFTKK